MIDPRFVSAAALFLIGLALVGFVVRVWMTHPVNRVFLIGRYVTADGLELILKNLPTVFALGLFSLTAAIAKVAYALRWAGTLSGHPADFIGTLEAMFSVWAACCVLLGVRRLCRER